VVRPLVHRPAGAPGGLRRQVCQRPDDLGVVGERGAQLGQRGRQDEIHHGGGATGREHDVGRADVPVWHPPAVLRGPPPVPASRPVRSARRSSPAVSSVRSGSYSRHPLARATPDTPAPRPAGPPRAPRAAAPASPARTEAAGPHRSPAAPCTRPRHQGGTAARPVCDHSRGRFRTIGPVPARQHLARLHPSPPRTVGPGSALLTATQRRGAPSGRRTGRGLHGGCAGAPRSRRGHRCSGKSAAARPAESSPFPARCGATSGRRGPPRGP
jgi:hypothetical protein